jgi:hypothetical protein
MPMNRSMLGNWNRWLCVAAVCVSGIGAGSVFATEQVEGPLELPEFRVEGTPWQHARLGDIEILSRAPDHRTRALVAALCRGQRLLPDFAQQRGRPLKLIVVQAERVVVAGLPKLKQIEANPKHWNAGYRDYEGGRYDLVDADNHVLALNLSGLGAIWPVLTTRAARLMAAQKPAFPEWALHGMFGTCGPMRAVIGMPSSNAVRLPKLSWPDPAVAPGVYPADAADFPYFAEMFDPTRDPEAMTREERWKFEFQAGLFARWSLFGPLKGGRDRSGFWAFAEMARRGQTTEDIFRQCYQMDWIAACAEMRRYLKSNGMGMIEVRMPQVMAEVPEADALQFNEAKPKDVKRILGEFRRLRELRSAAKPSEAPR